MSIKMNPTKCLPNWRFARHPASIQLGSILKAIRDSNDIPLLYETAVQATMEVIGDIHAYGPLTFSLKPGYNGEIVTVLYDQTKVLEMDRNDKQICIRYLRENDHRWVEELCALAEAHARLVLIEPR